MDNTKGSFDEIISDLKNLNATYGGMLNTDKLITGLDTLNSYETNESIMENVLQQERVDLNMRLQNMNDTVDTSKRILLLNESDRLRTADYNSMLYYFVIMIVLISIIAVIKNVFKIFPGSLFEILIVFVACTFLYLIYRKYVNIANRDIINYNEVAVPTPDNVALTDAQVSSTNKKNAASLSGGSLMNLQPVKCDDKKEIPGTTPMSIGLGNLSSPVIADTISTTRAPYTTPVITTTSAPSVGQISTTPSVTSTGSSIASTPATVINVNLDAAAVKELAESSKAATLSSTISQTTPKGATINLISQTTPMSTTLSSTIPQTTPKKSGFALMGDATPNSFYEYSSYSAL